MKKIFDKTFIKFVIVGVINTLFGAGIMFISYNVLNFSFWISSALNYILGSILSYYLNKNYTFESKTKGWKPMIRFIINITVCYLLAYGIAKPLVANLLANSSITIQENGAMLIGMILFVILNYTGQRFFTFKD